VGKLVGCLGMVRIEELCEELPSLCLRCIVEYGDDLLLISSGDAPIPLGVSRFVCGL